MWLSAEQSVGMNKHLLAGMAGHHFLDFGLQKRSSKQNDYIYEVSAVIIFYLAQHPCFGQSCLVLHATSLYSYSDYPDIFTIIRNLKPCSYLLSPN